MLKDTDSLMTQLKIEALISTTRRAITLTTNLKVERASAVFEANDAISLNQGLYPGVTELGAVVLTCSGSQTDCHQSAIDALGVELSNSFAAYSCWLLVCHSTTQPDTRVVRHRRLWDSLATRGLRLPDGVRTQESLVEEPSGLRWFGAVLCRSLDAEAMVQVLRAEAGAALVWAPTDSQASIERFVQHGWQVPQFGPAPEIVEVSMGIRGLVGTLVGSFDDAETGAALFASPTLLESLWK